MAKKEKNKGDFFKRMLDKVEVIGNKLPQPVTLFAMLMLITLLLSWV
ncbi:MAG: AbgT family transporter, partial [Mariniphaga sp.]|nr:AbgT family transporter [Mariniphaga sp.]